MGVAIKVENLSKAYQLGEIGTGTLSNDLKRWAYKVRGKEDPFLKIGETNDRTTKGESDMVWSLKDLNFEIEQGDAVGIIGRNGAGKSTLLKILSRVTSPTIGSVKVKGRVASLLEVGTGFHPELTGRENIFLNGAILGMRKAEIKKHFDAIVDFAGVERYIDTPVKRYSSGMYVRLAFAVAAHLESEILIVDEVLAVGDAEFQKKCLGKMNDVSKEEGRTVLFVSHNLNSMKDLCNIGIVLNNGLLDFSSNSIIESIDYYLDKNNESRSITASFKKDSTEINTTKKGEILEAYLKDENDTLISIPYGINNGKIKIVGKILLRENLSKCFIALHVKDSNENIILDSNCFDNNLYENLSQIGSYNFESIINLPLLKSGIYNITLGLTEHDINIDVLRDVLSFEIADDVTNKRSRHGSIYHNLNWKIY